MLISLNPNDYTDPTRFYPERCLNPDLNKPLSETVNTDPIRLRRRKMPRIL